MSALSPFMGGVPAQLVPDNPKVGVTRANWYPRLMRALGGVKLLILDDWGLEPLGPEQRHDMLEIVEDRYGRGATLITSQIPVDRWHDLIGEPTLADAILDRIIHNAHRLQLRGDSSRKQKTKIAAA
jgi:DNA replication protein DnaC